MESVLAKFRLDGQVALVTGGARGIGLSIAKAFLDAGAAVALLDMDLEAAQAAAKQLEEELSLSSAVDADNLPRVIALEVDVRDQASVESAVAKLTRRLGRLDIAVCNAGICINTPALETSLETWQKVLDVNLTGVFLTACAAARQMQKQGSGGSIINIASMSAHIVNQPQPQASYNASKAGVIQLTKSLAVEWAQMGIRVNSISPGYIGTDLTLESKVLKPLIPIWTKATPQERLGSPDELQGIALYLASHASSYATGSDFIVDGGFTSV